MGIEAAVGHAQGLHQAGDTDAVYPLLTEAQRRRLGDLGMGFLLVFFGMRMERP